MNQDFKRLVSALTLYSHNFRILHWYIVSEEFDVHHKIFQKYHKMLDEYLDEVAEIGLMNRYFTPSLPEAVEFLKDDEFKTYTIVLAKYTSPEDAYKLTEKMLSQLIELYESFYESDANITDDVVSKLHEHVYELRKELKYKNAHRLMD